MMLTSHDIASSLLARLQRERGHVMIAELEFVECEDGAMMCYVDTLDGACHPMRFEPPAGFDPREVEILMLHGLAQVVVH